MRLARLASVILLVAYGTGCTSYQTLADPAASLQSPPKPIRKARVTIDTGERFVVVAPRLIGDSLQGSLRDGVPVSVAMATVQEVEVRKPSPGKSVLLILGGVVLALATWAANYSWNNY